MYTNINDFEEHKLFLEYSRILEEIFKDSHFEIVPNKEIEDGYTFYEVNIPRLMQFIIEEDSEIIDIYKESKKSVKEAKNGCPPKTIKEYEEIDDLISVYFEKNYPSMVNAIKFDLM